MYCNAKGKAYKIGPHSLQITITYKGIKRASNYVMHVLMHEACSSLNIYWANFTGLYLTDIQFPDFSIYYIRNNWLKARILFIFGANHGNVATYFKDFRFT